MSNSCPICQKDDAIQRVVAVVQSGRSSGTYSGPSGGVAYSDGKWGSVSGYSTLSGSTVSDLAKSLVPPQEPQRGSLGLIFWLWLLVSCGTTLMAFCFFNGFLSTLLDVVANGRAYRTFELILGIPIIGLLLLPALLTIILYRSENKKRIQADTRYASEKPAWDQAMEKWNRLYFCHRDGIVFDPIKGDSCQPAQLKEFIYK